MKKLIIPGILILITGMCFAQPEKHGKYAIVVSNTTFNDSDWHKVVDTLYVKHQVDGVRIFKWNSGLNEVQSELSRYQPDYIGFVCRPVVETTEAFIRKVHQLSRNLDNDPYGDTVWGIITGFEAKDALRAIQSHLIVNTSVGGTILSNPYPDDPPLRLFYQAVGTYESKGGPYVRYSFNDYTVLDTTDASNIYPDRSITFAKWMNDEKINIQLKGHQEIDGFLDMFVTSGHANINNWQCHYPDPGNEGYIYSSNGQLYALTKNSGTIKISSPEHSKVWLCPGNCLIGNPDNINNMVYAWLHSANGIGFMGYMVDTWYGYQGWGTYGRFINFPGLYTLAESHFAVNQCLMFDLINKTAGTNLSGLNYDLDAVAVYGDPTSILMHPFPDTSWLYSPGFKHIKALSSAPDTFIFTIQTNTENVRPGTSVQPFYFLPVRIDPATVRIVATNAHQAVITDNFVMLYCWQSGEPAFPKGATRFVKWTADKVTDNIEEKPNIDSDGQITIIPNPSISSTIVHFSNSGNGKTTLSVYNIKGELMTMIENVTSHEIKIESNNWESGLYLITVRDKGGVRTTKFIKE